MLGLGKWRNWGIPSVGPAGWKARDRVPCCHSAFRYDDNACLKPPVAGGRHLVGGYFGDSHQLGEGAECGRSQDGESTVRVCLPSIWSSSWRGPC